MFAHLSGHGFRLLALRPVFGFEADAHAADGARVEIDGVERSIAAGVHEHVNALLYHQRPRTDARPRSPLLHCRR